MIHVDCDYTFEEKTDASVFERIIAYIIDVILLALVSFIVLYIALLSSPDVLMRHLIYERHLGLNIFIQATIFLSWTLYFTIMESSYGRGATFGKRFVSIRVEHSSGEFINLGRSFLRNIVRILWQTPCIGLFILAFETLVVASKGVRFGDIIVDTRVVKIDNWGQKQYEVYDDIRRYG